jgi:hypothetical protein
VSVLFIIEWQLGDAAFSSGLTTIVNATLIVDGRAPLSVGAQVGIAVGITFVWAVQNALRIDQQGWLNNLATFVQIGSTISTVIVLFAFTSHRATVSDVFTSTYNGTGFPFIYVCLISILSTLFSFSGYEGKDDRYFHHSKARVFFLQPVHISPKRPEVLDGQVSKSLLVVDRIVFTLHSTSWYRRHMRLQCHRRNCISACPSLRHSQCRSIYQSE